MKKKYFKDNDGNTVVFDPIGTDNGKCEFYIVWRGGYFLHKLKMHFREKHMPVIGYEEFDGGVDILVKGGEW